MGTVYRKTATKALPVGAEIFVRKGQRFARWQNAKGRARTAPLTIGNDGKERIVVTARTFTAKLRDGSGVVREVVTGCRDEQAARAILADLERRAVRVKAKLVSAAEDCVIDHLPTPFAAHRDAYLASLASEGTSPVHRANVKRALKRIETDCRLTTLAELKRDAFERWLAERAGKGMTGRTRNTYRAALVAFCNWCVARSRLAANPLAAVPKADEAAEPKRKRRSMTEAELGRLLDMARRRPLLDAMTIRRGERQGEAVAKVRPAVQAQLERLGRERALIYKTLVLTGLRKGEFASLTVGQLHLDGPHPYAELHAADEKNRQGSSIPLRADLAEDLRAWLDDKHAVAQQAAREAATVPFDSQAGRHDKRDTSDSEGRDGQCCLPLTGAPALPADTPLFTVPAGLVRILDRDLKLAGIPKRDERGRTIDVHALRHSFGTLLSKAGVPPRTAQAAMRHSSIDLTMNVYTDPKLLDVQGALDALPALPLDATPSEHECAKATGTNDLRPSPFAPAFAPTASKSSTPPSFPVKTADDSQERDAELTQLSAPSRETTR